MRKMTAFLVFVFAAAVSGALVAAVTAAVRGRPVGRVSGVVFGNSALAGLCLFGEH